MSKTAQGLVEYAKAQIGRPYWWGCFGQTASAALFETKRAQYPSYYTAGDFAAQYGQKVHDCVGLIKGYLWCDGPQDGTPAYSASQDVSVEGLYNACSDLGRIDEMPDQPGICVFMGSLGHVGVYIGNGEVVEAMGHAYGTVKTKLNGRGWVYWGRPKWIDYGAKDIDVPTSSDAPDDTPKCMVELPQIEFGSKGEAVRSMQIILISRGYTCGTDGADGDFGLNTLSALAKFQLKAGLYDDGICGPLTWAKLIGG